MSKSPSRKNSNKEGKEFEDMLTAQFNKYRAEGKMYCIKVPTEIVLIRNGAKIVSAFPKAKSEALDYLGILSTGECITFEAKSSNNKTSFPLSQIKEYQFELHKEIRNYTKKVFYIILILLRLYQNQWKQKIRISMRLRLNVDMILILFSLSILFLWT